MIILIPLGGLGKRFRDNGYKQPKALINIFGKPIIYYLLDNLKLNNIDYVYIPYNKEYINYNLESRLKKDYSNINFKFLCLKNNTRGAAETINIALEHLDINEDKPILCLDSDNFYLYNIIDNWQGKNCVFTIKDNGDKHIYSYVNCDNDNNIIDIKEKVKISDFACTGAYGFNSMNQLKKYTKKIITDNITQISEFYTSGVIKEMVNDNIIIKQINIEEKKFVCLGTPIQLKLFYNNYPKKSCIKNNILITSKRICFDLDNTLVTFPVINGDYTSVLPIEKNINLLRYLKKFNNTIIIYTARRMKTHSGNVGKINADIGKITFETLEKFDIPYDEIYFGKPYADFYIDDLAINCYDDIEKELGFYNNFIKPRDFNNIEISNIDLITKNGNDLAGEIFYYKNIPDSVKDLFPIFFNSEGDSYEIERINGITLTDLYLSELLTEDIFKNVLNSIIRLHNTNIIDNTHIISAGIFENNTAYSGKNITNKNIYNNYSDKVERRYKNYDYSRFEKSSALYIDLMEKLNEYQNNNLGKMRIIHGDPVFTNIIINNYDKIKFIDMRGKIGDKFTIYGDWLYDFAKIYQSLIGYDMILLSKNISRGYQENMISCFKNYFINKYSEKDFNNVKLITKSLLFSLLPLHDNIKCKSYYNLIYSEYLE